MRHAPRGPPAGTRLAARGATVEAEQNLRGTLNARFEDMEPASTDYGALEGERSERARIVRSSLDDDPRRGGTELRGAIRGAVRRRAVSQIPRAARGTSTRASLTAPPAVCPRRSLG